MAVKAKRAPYARRSVWYVIIALATVVVIGFGLGGYEIYHLHNQVDGLQSNVNSLQNQVKLLNAVVANLVLEMAKLAPGH